MEHRPGAMYAFDRLTRFVFMRIKDEKAERGRKIGTERKEMKGEGGARKRKERRGKEGERKKRR